MLKMALQRGVKDPSNIESIAAQPENLKGMIVNREQAVALAQLLGIIVK